jgi:hypothetical protein
LEIENRSLQPLILHPLSSLILLGAPRRLGGSAFILICVGALIGCRTTVTPPQDVRDPVTVAFTDYGRHTSIILPVKQNEWAEYAAGDWAFFALGHNDVLSGLRALLGIGDWTIGRRYLNFSPTLPGAAQKLGVARVVTFRAERSYSDTLHESLDAIFKAHRDQVFYSSYSGLYHVIGSEHYYIFHNCNHSTANWLRLLGCDVDGSSITSSFDLAPSRPGVH